jgi:hypothetical protein
MPYEVATPAIQTALETILLAYSPLTALLATKPTPKGGGAAIYTEGDASAQTTFPYLLIGPWTQNEAHALGETWGWNCTVQLKVVGQRPGLQASVMSKVYAALPQGLRLTVTGYGSAWVDEATLPGEYQVIEAGKITYQLPAIFRVVVHDS